MTRREEIAEQRQALRRPSGIARVADDWILVAILLAILQLTHSLTFGWAATGGIMLGYIIVDIIYVLLRRGKAY